MDRFSRDDAGNKGLIFQGLLEFVGEVRAGISWKRFCILGIRYSDALIEILNETDDAKSFLASKGISWEYAHDHAAHILNRLHFNKEDDHYLTLALPHHASESQIHKRWKDLLLIYHPDKNSDEGASQCAKRINEAYSVLKSVDRRLAYEGKRLKAGGGLARKNEIKSYQPPKPKRYLIRSPRTRRLVPKLIIPCCVIVSCSVLFIMYLENRQRVSTYQAPIPPGTRGQALKSSERTTVEPSTPKTIDEQTAGPLRERPESSTASWTEKRSVTKKDRSAGAQKRKAVTLPASVSHEVREVPSAATGSGARRDIIERTPSPKTALLSRNVTPDQNEVPDEGQTTEVFGNVLQKTFPLKQNEPLAGPQKAAGPQSGPPQSGEAHEDFVKETHSFLAQYIHAYEQGDIARFMEFFSRDVLENNSMRYDDIRTTYQKNFESNRYRYALKNVQIQKRDDAVLVTGDYSIRKLIGNDRGDVKNGNIRWVLARENGTFRIRRIDYDKR